nr:PQQ-binding-like beta-propeller repeat protein [Armatimonadota bacterium]
MKHNITILCASLILFSLVAFTVTSLESTTGAKKIWKRKLSRWGVSGSPVTGPGNLVYAAGYDNYLYGVDSATGDVRWKTNLNHGPHYPPTVHKSTVIIGTVDGRLIAVDAIYGTLKWEFEEPESRVVDQPLVDPSGTIFVGYNSRGTNGGQVAALDGDTGNVKWRFRTNAGVMRIAMDTRGTLYVGTGDSIHALDTRTRKERWTFPQSGAFIAVGGPQDDTVAISSRQYKLYAVDASTGKERWMFSPETYLGSFGPTIDPDGTVYTATIRDVRAFDRESGTVKWQQKIGNGFIYSPTLGPAGTLLVGSDQDAVYALDRKTGSKIWKCKLDWNWKFGIN